MKVRNWVKYQYIPLQATSLTLNILTSLTTIAYHQQQSAHHLHNSELQYLSICVHVMHPKRLHPTTSHARYSEDKYLLQRHAVEEY